MRVSSLGACGAAVVSLCAADAVVAAAVVVAVVVVVDAVVVVVVVVVTGAEDEVCAVSDADEELLQLHSRSRQAAAVRIYLIILSPPVLFLPILTRTQRYVKPKSLRCGTEGFREDICYAFAVCGCARRSYGLRINSL